MNYVIIVPKEKHYELCYVLEITVNVCFQISNLIVLFPKIVSKKE